MTGVLNAILRKHDLGTCRPGTLVLAERSTFDEAAPAMRRFLDFGGRGWLCTAESRTIFHTQSDETWPPSTEAWPLQGELADGHRSLHLQRTSSGWDVAIIEETGTEIGSPGFLFDTFLHAHPAQQPIRLSYAVAYAPVLIGAPGDGHEELRPTAYRFTGLKT